MRSEAVLYRKLAQFDHEEGWTLYSLIADMGIAEFLNLLCRLNITELWLDNYGTVLFEPLAQHYG